MTDRTRQWMYGACALVWLTTFMASLTGFVGDYWAAAFGAASGWSVAFLDLAGGRQ